MMTRTARKRQNSDQTKNLADKTIDLNVSSTSVRSEHSVNSENSAKKAKDLVDKTIHLDVSSTSVQGDYYITDT